MIESDPAVIPINHCEFVLSLDLLMGSETLPILLGKYKVYRQV